MSVKCSACFRGCSHADGLVAHLWANPVCRARLNDAHWQLIRKEEDDYYAKYEFFCCKCDKRFQKWMDMEQHWFKCGVSAEEEERLYRKERPYACDVCRQKAFKTESALLDHVTTCGKS